MRKFMPLAMAAVLSLTMMGCASSTGTDTASKEATTEESNSAISSFEELLESPFAILTYDGEDHSVGDFSYYAYTDIDQDGADELILSTTPDSFLAQGESALIVANENDEMVPIFYTSSEAGAEFRSDASDAVLTSYSRSSGEEHAAIYELKDGQLNQIKTLDSWEPYHKDDSGNPVYQIDGKDVSEEDYTAAWDQYYEDAEEISYDSIDPDEEATESTEDVSLYSANVDIDQDGTDEFIISTTSDSFLQQGDSAIVIANVGDETVPLLTVNSDAGAELRLDEDDSVLTVYTRCSGEQHAVVYKLKDDELKQVKTLDHWEPGHSDDAENDVYEIDGEKVSKEDFESAWEQYYENATAISYPDAE